MLNSFLKKSIILFLGGKLLFFAAMNGWCNMDKMCPWQGAYGRQNKTQTSCGIPAMTDWLKVSRETFPAQLHHLHQTEPLTHGRLGQWSHGVDAEIWSRVMVAFLSAQTSLAILHHPPSWTWYFYLQNWHSIFFLHCKILRKLYKLFSIKIIGQRGTTS